MIFQQARSRLGPRAFLVATVVGAVLGPAPSTMAALTLGYSSGSAYFSLYNLGSEQVYLGTSLPYFNAPDDGGALLSPGYGLPTLIGTGVGASQAVNSTSSLYPYPGFFAASSGAILPSTYGSAATDIYVASAGQQGASTTQGGVFYSVASSLADALPSPDQSMASVSVSTGSATFTNNTLSPFLLTPGAALSVNGTINDSDAKSYVAAGLTTVISYGYGESMTTTQLDSIVMAGNTVGSFALTINPATGLGDTSNPYYLSGQETASSHLTASGLLTGTGSVFDPSRVDLMPGESITVTSVLTFISDPGSSIGISAGIDPGFTGGLPDFGAFAGPAVVPEPSTALLLGSGLALAGLWCRPRRRRGPAAG